MKPKSLALTALMILSMIACSTNPATGRREINLVSEGQEQALGEQAHRQMLQQFKVYDEKPELNRMLERIGQRLATVSDRPDLPWTFTLLDSPMLNAMALPGGYIYITRGMVERMNSTDELAGILAHEIAHVTARHAAQRISQAQLAQLGLVAGAIAAGPQAAQAYGGLAELGLNLLFLSYSRQQESQADLLGTAYSAEAGFNPVGAERMLQTLERLRGEESAAIDRYFQSHPDPGRRVRDVRQQIEQLAEANPAIVTVGLDRPSFVSTLEGMITGRSTMRTTIKNSTVYERTYGMILPYPEGYQAYSGFGGLFQVVRTGSSGGTISVDEIPLATLNASARNAQAALRRHLEQMGLQYVGSREASARTGERFVIDVWAGRTQQGTVAVETTQFVSGDHVVAFMEISPSLRQGQSALANTLEVLSFDRSRARNVEPPRLRVDQVPARSTWASLAQRATGDPSDANEIALINGFDPGSPVPSGLAVKLPQQIIERD